MPRFPDRVVPRFPTTTRTLSLGLLASFFVDLFFGLVKIMQRKGQRCVHGCIDDRRTQAGPRVSLAVRFHHGRPAARLRAAAAAAAG